MRDASRLIAAAVGARVVLCVSAAVSAQTPQAIVRVASLPSGTIQGLVEDETGAPVAGAMVSALGASTTFGVTDRLGHFALRSLSPGPYIVRAHMAGFVAPRGQIVQVLPSTRASSSIALRHVNAGPVASPPIVPASVGGLVAGPDPTATEADPPAAAADETVGAPKDTVKDGEIEWRLRHARRSILNDAVDQVLIAAASPEAGAGGFGPRSGPGRTVGASPARVAANFFADTPFFGQVNLLTTSSFDAPQDLFTMRAFPARGIANVLVGAPVGDHADWTVRGAVTQGDIASWVVFGDYVTRAPARHRYDVGLTYSTQRRAGGNFAALRSVTDGSRKTRTLQRFERVAKTAALAESEDVG